MTISNRHLAPLEEPGQAVFFTWRLHGSLPPSRAFQVSALGPGQAFATKDRPLDEIRTGPLYLRQPALAEMVVDSIYFNASILGHFDLHAFVVMPNHVHILATPTVKLQKLTKALKGITSKRATAILRLTAPRFWQKESFDYLVRTKREFEKILDYIEESPVRAGLAREVGEFPWSSAAWRARGPATEPQRDSTTLSCYPGFSNYLD